MRKDIKKGDWDFELMKDLWNIYKEFYIPEDTNEYWTKLTKARDDFAEKYKSKFAEDLVMGVYDELERRYKQMFKGAIA